MDVDYSPAKNEANIAKHGISLDRAVEFDFLGAKFEIVLHGGETRVVGIGMLDGDVHVLVFKQAAPTVIRAISLRRASYKEGKRYEDAKARTG